MAAGCVLPFRVTSWLSSIGPVMRTAGAACCAKEMLDRNSAPASTHKGRERRFDISVVLDFYLRRNTRRAEKLCFLKQLEDYAKPRVNHRGSTERLFRAVRALRTTAAEARAPCSKAAAADTCNSESKQRSQHRKKGKLKQKKQERRIRQEDLVAIPRR